MMVPVSVLDRELLPVLLDAIAQHKGTVDLTGHEIGQVCFTLAALCGWLIGKGYYQHPDALFSQLIATLNDQIWAQLREAQREQRALDAKKPKRSARRARAP